MLFTGNDIVQYALDRAVRSRDAVLPPHLIARQLNDLVRSLTRKVIAEDPERLAEEVIISHADTIASSAYVDLTASDTREWMNLLTMDWSSAAGGDYEDEVIVGTIEARQRLETEFGHLANPIGYLYDRLRKLKKVSGWDGVYDLRAYGVLLPTPWDPQDAEGFTRVMDLPEPMFRALQTGFLIRVSPHLKPSDLELKLWLEENSGALEDMMEDAKSFVDPGLRLEDVPHSGFEV